MKSLDHLSDIQVHNLINSLKKFKEELPKEMPNFGKIKDDTLVLGVHDNIEYKLHRYRHPYDDKRYSIHLRFKGNNDILVRIDVNNGTHRNPNGEKISSNHMHIYKDSHYAKDAYAYPLPTTFTDLESIFSALEDFLLYTRIREYSA